MSEFERVLGERLQAIHDQGLGRELRQVDSPPGREITWAGRTLLNFASNDYLGLANDPALKQAAIAAVQAFGAGSAAARLMSGSLAPHHQLEAALAEFKAAEAALSFSSGYATALGVVGTLMSREDVVVLDKLVHASIVDAARLCGATLRVFHHNDLNDLEAILRWADQRAAAASGTGRRPRVLIATESVFSMDGDCAPLAELVELKDRYGAWLLLDEAHATGLFGERGAGLAAHLGLAHRIEVQMGTLGKALGAAGGFICGSRRLIDLLINRARSFIYSTGPVPAAAAAALEGVRFVQSPAGVRRREMLSELLRISAELFPQPKIIPLPQQVLTPIRPILLGAEAEAVAVASRLRDAGLFVPAIRFPTVARGQARLRVSVTALHQASDLQALAAALARTPGPAAILPR